MMSDNSIAVIGGGASGMLAALSAARTGAEVTIYEACDRVGKKILATGNGRCNMTNINADIKDYHGKNPSFINGVKEQFWVKETLEFFQDLGLLYKTEEKGKVYPYSDTATSVLDVLRIALEQSNVHIVTNTEIKELIKKKNGFMLVSFGNERYFHNKVIVATGGKAAPALGSKGSGYEILQKFGHTLTELKPSLVQLKTDGDVAKKLKGIKLQGTLTIENRSETGEILFTEYGLSGPPVFYLSAYAKEKSNAYIDIMPDYKKDDIISILYTRICKNPSVRLESFFVGMLNKRVGEVFLKSIGIAPLSRRADTLSEEEIERIASSLKAWEFTVSGTMSWNNAQVTRGGICTDEFDPKTLQSKKQPGIYACGEILDIDGDCGGYNLQWAWASGHIAGVFEKIPKSISHV